VEIQQSPLYRKYIELWGWTVLTLDGVNIFIRKIPFYGVLAKIQRPIDLPYIPRLVPFLKRHKVQRVLVEPTQDTNEKRYQEEIKSLSKFFSIHKESFLPTKTIYINLTKPKKELFQSFTESKRRGVRRAQKNRVIVKESNSIQDFIRTKNSSAGFLGEITTSGVNNLWNIFSPDHAAILLAYHNPTVQKQNNLQRHNLILSVAYSFFSGILSPIIG